ncbi:diguanylate cyclase [Vibrio harveyi]|nr:diguanylate cyclase [Vibrio harveyi]
MIAKSTQLIKSVLNGKSLLYRIGGDEFAVIAKDLSIDALNELITRLEVSQQNKWVELSEHNRYPVQFSVGGASSESVSIENLFSIADEAMYEKKRAFYQK